jgi:hypothetical protein
VDRIPNADAPFEPGALVVQLNDCKTWFTDDAHRCDVSDYQIQSYDPH